MNEVKIFSENKQIELVEKLTKVETESMMRDVRETKHENANETINVDSDNSDCVEQISTSYTDEMNHSNVSQFWMFPLLAF